MEDKSKSNEKLLDTLKRVLEYLNNENIRPKLPFKYTILEATKLTGGFMNYIYRIKYDNN